MDRAEAPPEAKAVFEAWLACPTVADAGFAIPGERWAQRDRHPVDPSGNRCISPPRQIRANGITACGVYFGCSAVP